jgi:transposase
MDSEYHTKIARILDVNRSSLYRWRTMARARPDGLKAKRHPGPRMLLEKTQLKALERLLAQGAKRHGWANELWTSKRVKILIQEHLGVSYHEGNVRKILKDRLHWTCQKPELRARERDETEIERWKQEEFPRIKKSAGQRSYSGVSR